MARAVVLLPLPIIFLIGLMLVLNFVVITQWERLQFAHPVGAPCPQAAECN
jgi:hypothetical protein